MYYENKFKTKKQLLVQYKIYRGKGSAPKLKLKIRLDITPKTVLVLKRSFSCTLINNYNDKEYKVKTEILS